MKLSMIALALLLGCAAAAHAAETSPAAESADTGASNAFSPRRGATDLVVRTIGAAQSSICAVAYSFTSGPIADALLAAQARGVAVRLTLDKSQARGRHLMLTRLLAASLPVRINRHYAIMHDKFMVIDARVLQLGSFNYTKAAEEKNAENVLVIRKYKKVIASYAAECDRLWDEADAPAPLELPAVVAPDRRKPAPLPYKAPAPYKARRAVNDLPPLVSFN